LVFLSKMATVNAAAAAAVVWWLHVSGKVKVVAFLLSVLLVARLMQAAPQAGRTTSDDADRIHAAEEVLRAHEHPETAFPGPGPNPILMLTWFNHGDPRVAM
jgi:hypothetical protein